MFLRVLAIPFLALSLLLSGCATPTTMAFSDEKQTIDPNKPIFLLTVTQKNIYKTSWQPKLLVVNVEKPVVTGSEDRINFTLDDKAKSESDSPTDGNNYLLRMELEKGEYVLRGLTSFNHGFLVNGFFFAPLHEKLDASKSGVYYLGHIDATVRERQGNEFKAGASAPLIDQAVVGASTGTFDIVVTDAWDKDEAKFRSQFPALSGVTIEKAILPPFDREKAQTWWEAH